MLHPVLCLSVPNPGLRAQARNNSTTLLAVAPVYGVLDLQTNPNRVILRNLVELFLACALTGGFFIRHPAPDFAQHDPGNQRPVVAPIERQGNGYQEGRQLFADHELELLVETELFSKVHDTDVGCVGKQGDDCQKVDDLLEARFLEHRRRRCRERHEDAGHHKTANQ